MKIARTFTIDWHLYQELRRKPNQSRIVERAVKRYLAGDEDFDIVEVSTKRLMAVLMTRDDIPERLRTTIHEILFPELHFSE